MVVTSIRLIDAFMFGYDRPVYESSFASYWFHFCNAIASLRILKAFAAIQVGVVMSRTLFRIIPAVLNLLSIIFAVMYAVSLLGMEWYSGPPYSTSALVPTNPRLKNATDWLPLASVMQFGDLSSALVCTFQVATVVSGRSVVGNG